MFKRLFISFKMLFIFFTFPILFLMDAIIVLLLLILIFPYWIITGNDIIDDSDKWAITLKYEKIRKWYWSAWREEIC